MTQALLLVLSAIGVAPAASVKIRSLPQQVDPEPQGKGKHPEPQGKGTQPEPQGKGTHPDPQGRGGGHLGASWTNASDLSNWLISTEARYGGYVTNVPCMDGLDHPVAKHFNYRCTGGDRMSPLKHNYAPCYARLIDAHHAHWGVRQHDDAKPLVAEVGILKGSGLATWSELFPGYSVHGFDIDLSNTQANLPSLRAKGAFKQSEPSLHAFNQLTCNSSTVANAASGKYVFVVDDGMHTIDTMLRTFQAFRPHLAKGAVYVMEDAPCVNDRKLCLNMSSDLLHSMGTGYKIEVCPEAPLLWMVTEAEWS